VHFINEVKLPQTLIGICKGMCMLIVLHSGDCCVKCVAYADKTDVREYDKCDRVDVMSSMCEWLLCRLFM
jgi:hypothetical protein